MSDLRICRICLATDVKMYNYDQNQLKSYYEDVMALKVNDRDNIPHYFCYECANILHKYHKFKEKCYIGHRLLKKLTWTGMITYEAVKGVDRASCKLNSPLGILVLTSRVKAYNAADIVSGDIKNEEPTLNDTDPFELGNDVFLNISNEDDVMSIEATNFNYDDIMDHDNIMAPDENPFDENDLTMNKFETLNPIEIVKDDDQDLISENNTFDKLSQIIHKTSITAKKPANINRKQSKQSKPVIKNVKKLAVAKEKKPNAVSKRGRRRSFSEYGLTNKRTGGKPSTKIFNPNHWMITMLSDEDAVKAFKAKSENEKYIAAKFKCTDCFKGYLKEETLKRHKQLVHRESRGQLQCRFCHARFKHQHQLRKHLMFHFKKYHCLRCDLFFWRECSAILHDQYHNGVLWKCKHCNIEFKHSSSYYTHLRTHRSDHVCKLCGASFVSALGLFMHGKKNHLESNKVDAEDEVATYCETCDIRFETRDAYKEHFYHSAQHSEVVDGYEVELEHKKKNCEPKNGQVIQNLKGISINTSPSRLRRRSDKIVGRTTRIPTTCQECGKHFDSRSACMKHHMAEHPSTSFRLPTNMFHICEICGVSLPPNRMSIHMNTHTREKVYKCSICGKTFSTKSVLETHGVTHTGEKKFPCSLCDKRFTQRVSMQLHYRTFHLKEPYPKRNRKKKIDIIEPDKLPWSIKNSKRE